MMKHTRVFDLTPKARKGSYQENIDLSKAAREYNEAALVLEDKRVRLLSIARKLAGKNPRARKLLDQVTDTIAF